MNKQTVFTPIRLIIIGSVILIAYAVWLFLSTPLYSGYKATKLPFRTSNHTQLSGTNLYSYNGAAFFKVSTTSQDKPDILSTDFHLPAIERLTWADDEGVLVTFTDGGYIGSDLESALTARGQAWNETTRRYVWFADFSDKKLHLVSTNGLASNALYYSDKEKSLYYFRNGEIIPESDQNITSLARYSLATHTEEVIDSNFVNAYEITYLGACRNDTVVCFIRSNPNGETGIYTVTSSQKTEKLAVADSYDMIIPTASSNIFFGLTNQETDINAREDEVLTASVDRISLSDNIAQKLNTYVQTSDSLVANTDKDDKFYIIGRDDRSRTDSLTLLSGAKNILGSYKVKATTLKNEIEGENPLSILPPVSYGSNGLMTFQHVDEHTYLLASEEQSVPFMEKIPSTTSIETQLKSCFDKYTVDHDYSDTIRQFKIGIKYDSNYQSTIKAFSGCVAKSSPDSLLGYSFVYAGLHPQTGRYVTD